MISRAQRIPPPAVPRPHLRVIPPAAGLSPTPRTPAVPNAIVGVLIFLATEAMVFGGLISAFLVLRANAAVWPPAGQPRLPIAITALNTLILILSGYAMQRALRAVRQDRLPQLRGWLRTTAALGVLFLVVQGAEWVRLIGYGLHVTSGSYGSTFYTLIGCHGLHALIGVLLVGATWWHAGRGRYSAQNHVGVEVCRLYWTFVVAVWPVLYTLVYLT